MLVLEPHRIVHKLIKNDDRPAHKVQIFIGQYNSFTNVADCLCQALDMLAWFMRNHDGARTNLDFHQLLACTFYTFIEHNKIRIPVILLLIMHSYHVEIISINQA